MDGDRNESVANSGSGPVLGSDLLGRRGHDMPDKLDMVYDMVKETHSDIKDIINNGTPLARNNEKRLNAKDTKGVATQSGIVAFVVAAVESARYFIGKQ